MNKLDDEGMGVHYSNLPTIHVFEIFHKIILKIYTFHLNFQSFIHYLLTNLFTIQMQEIMDMQKFKIQ